MMCLSQKNDVNKGTTSVMLLGETNDRRKMKDSCPDRRHQGRLSSPMGRVGPPLLTNQRPGIITGTLNNR